jgi:hypothetical protein
LLVNWWAAPALCHLWRSEQGEWLPAAPFGAEHIADRATAAERQVLAVEAAMGGGVEDVHRMN